MGNVNKEICGIVRSRLDAYLDDELVGDETEKITRHLKSCAACRNAADEILLAKKLLRRAVQSEVAPEILREKIQKGIRSKPRYFGFLFARKLSVPAVAVGLIICFGMFGIFTLHRQSSSNLVGKNDANRILSRQTTEILEIGLGDHVHCALEEGYAHRHAAFEEAARNLAAEYAGLVLLMKEKTDGSFEVVAAHRCLDNERAFVHLILKKDEKILSLAITKKGGETFSGAAGGALLQPSGVALYQEDVRGFAVAGFETETDLVFFVSNLSGAENLRIASAAAPAVQDFLGKPNVNS